MKVRIRNFRSFYEPMTVDVRPLTILVGENSAGKSSFLALIRYVVDFISGFSNASFNKDPFYLGAYEQIAHFRGGKAGRSEVFSVSIHFEATPRPPTRPPYETPQSQNMSLTLCFKNNRSQPIVSEAVFESANGVLSLKIDDEKPILRLNGEVLQLESDDLVTSRIEFGRIDYSFLMASVREASFVLRRSEKYSRVSPERPSRRVELIVDALAGFRSQLRRSSYASAPVRMKPSRTYSPGDEPITPDGNHVPFLLARLKRYEGSEWTRIKNAIDRFGENSGLFKGLDVRNLGRSESDPFQLVLDVGGPTRNIIDVGYGVSQVLPIITEVFRQSHRMMFLFQQPEVHLHPQAQAALGSFLIENVSENSHFIVETHSDFIIDRVRMAVRDQKLRASDVNIIYFERERLQSEMYEMNLSESGEVLNAPPHYRQFFLFEMAKSLG